MEEHVGDEEEVEVTAVGGQQDYRPLANSLLDLAWKEMEVERAIMPDVLH